MPGDGKNRSPADPATEAAMPRRTTALRLFANHFVIEAERRCFSVGRANRFDLQFQSPAVPRRRCASMTLACSGVGYAMIKSIGFRPPRNPSFPCNHVRGGNRAQKFQTDRRAKFQCELRSEDWIDVCVGRLLETGSRRMRFPLASPKSYYQESGNDGKASSKKSTDIGSLGGEFWLCIMMSSCRNTGNQVGFSGTA
jgi:hypothetical protein